MFTHSQDVTHTIYNVFFIRFGCAYQYVRLNLLLIESPDMGCVAEVLIASLAQKTRPDSSDVVRCRQNGFMTSYTQFSYLKFLP